MLETPTPPQHQLARRREWPDARRISPILLHRAARPGNLGSEEGLRSLRWPAGAALTRTRNGEDDQTCTYGRSGLRFARRLRATRTGSAPPPWSDPRRGGRLCQGAGALPLRAGIG